MSDFEARLQEAPHGGLHVVVPAARAAFDALSCSHGREHAVYVAEAKKAETRERRAKASVERLLGGG